MRISSINVAQPVKTNYNLRTKNVQNPNFQSKGGATGTVVGAGIGLLLTAISGGSLFWTVPLISGSCGIGGDIYYENKKKPSNGDSNSYDFSYIPYRD